MARPTKKTQTAVKRAVPARAPAKKAAAKKTTAKAPVKAPAKKAAPAKKVAAAKAPAKKAAPKKAAAKPAAVAKAPAKKAVAKKTASKKVVATAAAPAKPAVVTPAATKTVAKVAAKPEPPKPKRKPAPKWSDKELAEIRQDLLDHRATYEKEFEDLESGSLAVAQSEMSGEVSYDEESADAGTFTFERERDLSLSNNIRDLMDKVDSAMTKLDEGTYGVCERCGNGIDKARLKALPYSVLCITCKQQEERIR